MHYPDWLREIQFDEKRPGIHNLLTIYKAFTGMDKAEIESHFQGQGYAELKHELIDVVVAELMPLQARYREWLAKPQLIDRILQEGRAAVQPLAEETLSKVKKKIGLG